MSKIIFPSEWAPQSAIMLAWPHRGTDWSDMLKEVQSCFSEIIKTISEFQNVLLLVNDANDQKEIAGRFNARVHCLEVPTNDTWARDFGPVFIKHNNKSILLDFKFNGWGLKFGADKDNLINSRLFKQDLFRSDVIYCNRLNFVLEGGSFESDGQGTLLTSSECLLSPNRNGEWNQEQIEQYLKENLGPTRVLWLNNGFLAGDDTDSHIDTLARFCNEHTIAYVKCDDKKDVHFDALLKMEAELKNFRDYEGNYYNLIPLPFADTIYYRKNRLPATYANFLIINDAVIVPTYNSQLDGQALSQLTLAFPERKIIGIDCSSLIKQNGSLHCVTMQLPMGVLNEKFYEKH